MDNPITKFLDGLKKQAVKSLVKGAEEQVERKLTAKEKSAIKDDVSPNFTVAGWFEKNLASQNLQTITSFIPSVQHETLFDLLALDVGYKRTVKKAVDDKFPIIKELLDELNDHQFEQHTEIISQLNPDLIPIYVFFGDVIKTARAKGIRPIDAVIDKINALSPKAKEGTKVSHAPKFTNPEVKTPRIYAKAAFGVDGFVRTGNAEIDFDMHINAASLQVYKFLSLEIDGRAVLNLFEEGNFQCFASVFTVERKQFDFWAESFCACLLGNDEKTDRLLKQVYFPVGNSYHQLSLLFPSGLAFGLKERIDRLNTLSTESYIGKKRKRKNEHFENGFSSVLNLTIQRYGGDHPKNISALNNKHQNVYLLSSSPPILAERKIQPPRRNFFRDSLWLKPFQDDFQKFHDLLRQDRNNMHVRNKRDWLIRAIIYQVADRLWTIRSLEPGWSESDNYQQLPAYQKIWMDQVYKSERQEDSVWFAQVQKELAGWFVRSYRKLQGHDALSLADDELPHIKKMITKCEEALR